MAVTAKIELEANKLLYQQTTKCTAVIDNAGNKTLNNVNPRNYDGGPTFVVTEVASGTVSKFRRERPGGQAPYQVDLPAGYDLSFEYSLTQIIRFPGPGTYDIQAHYAWDGGDMEVLSPAVRVELVPATPRTLGVASGKGGVAPIYYAAWANALDGGKSFEVWLSEIITVPKPRVVNCFHLADVKQPVEPVVSVPPNEDAFLQWIAWLEKNKLNYVSFLDGEVDPVASTKLDSDDYRIVPPLLQGVPGRGKHATPGVDVLLLETVPGESGGAWTVAHIDGNGKGQLEGPIDLSGARPRWAHTAYLAKQARHTFFITSEKNKSSLLTTSWSPVKPPGTAKSLTQWPAQFVAASLWWNDENEIGGAMLGAKGEGPDATYALYPWRYDASGAFKALDEVPVGWKSEHSIDVAIVRVDANGNPYALLRTDPKGPGWSFCQPNGSVVTLTGPPERLQLPAELIFGGGTDPLVMFGDPGRGFVLSPPG